MLLELDRSKGARNDLKPADTMSGGSDTMSGNSETTSGVSGYQQTPKDAKVGQMLLELDRQTHKPDTVSREPVTVSRSNPKEYQQTLKDAHLDARTARRWQNIARIPESTIPKMDSRAAATRRNEMGLFKFSQEAVERHADRMARQHLAEAEREAAAPAKQPDPAPVITAEHAASLGIDPTDPFLLALQRQESARHRPASGQDRAAGRPRNEPHQTLAPSKSAGAARKQKASSCPAGQPTKEQVRRFEDNILQVLSNLHMASRRDVARTVHADRHPEAFRQAWQHLRRAGRIIETDPQGRRQLWRRPDAA